MPLAMIGAVFLVLGSGEQLARGAATVRLSEFPSPNARTTHAYGIGPTEAILLGFINPHGAETTARFEIGRTKSYGQSYPPGPPEHFWGRNEPVEVEQAVDRLRPRTNYHFRIVATSEGGTTYGTDKTFRTPPR